MSVIIVQNIRNGERLTYSLPALIGSVRNPNPNQNSYIFVKQHGKSSSAWPICGGQFKIFVDLKPGRNDFVLSFLENENVADESDVHLTLHFEQTKFLYFVRPVYIICADDQGCFQGPDEEDCSVESAVKRIALSARLLQSFIAEKLHEQGFKRKTFALECDLNPAAAVPACHVFKSKLTLKAARKMSGSELWMAFARELMTSGQFGSKNMCKWFAFMSFTRYVGVAKGHLPPSSHNEVLKMTKGHTALGGGGLALYGTGTLHCWAASLDELIPRFSDVRKMDRTKFMDDSAYREFLWANYSTGLGAALHELSHTFDLAHTSTGIMARGFDDLHRALTVCHHISASSSALSFASPLLSSPFSNYSLSDDSSSPGGPSSLVLTPPSSAAGPRCSSLPTSPRCHASSASTNTSNSSRRSLMNGSPKPCCPPGRSSRSSHLTGNESPIKRPIHSHNFYDVSAGNKPLPLVVIETSFKKLNMSTSHAVTLSDYDGSRTTRTVTRSRDGSETALEVTLCGPGDGRRKTVKERVVHFSSKKSKTVLSMTVVSERSTQPPTSDGDSTADVGAVKLPEFLRPFQERRYSDGGAHWYRSSAVLLNGHKWFNSFAEDPFESSPTMEGLVISCPLGVYLVELRTVLDGMVFHHYEFDCDSSSTSSSSSPSSSSVSDIRSVARDGDVTKHGDAASTESDRSTASSHNRHDCTATTNGDDTATPDTNEEQNYDTTCRNLPGESISTCDSAAPPLLFRLNASEILALAPPGEDDVGVLVMDRRGNVLKKKLLHKDLVALSASSSSLSSSLFLPSSSLSRSDVVV